MTDPLAVIESINTVADLLDSMKTALTNRGWSDMNAEAASVTFYQIERTISVSK